MGVDALVLELVVNKWETLTCIISAMFLVSSQLHEDISWGEV